MPSIKGKDEMQLTKRRLTDLWVVGKELTLDDGQGEAVKVWIQKTNAVESSDISRRCDAARAKVMACRGDLDSVEWQATMGSVREYSSSDPARLVEFLLMDERTRLQRLYEQKTANGEKWSKDNYIQGLYDAWSKGLDKRWIEDHDDYEASQCKAELDRFTKEVSEQVDDEVEVLRDAWMHQSEPELEERMAFKLLEMDAGQAWLNELWACQIFYGTREADNTHTRYFTDRDEVDALTPPTFERLREAYSMLEVDAAEGKDSPAPTPSSPSSEGPSEAATDPSSGPVGANR